MKNLADSIKCSILDNNNQRNDINESAMNIIYGILGYKIIDGLFDLFGSLIKKPYIKAYRKKLEECQREMLQILNKYPGSQKQFEKDLYVRLHSKTTGDGIILSIERHPELLNNSLDSFTEEDKNKFMELYNEVAKIQDEVFSKINTIDIYTA